MKTVFIFHGTGGYPEENWFGWAKKKFEDLNCKVIVPQFPTPQNQTPQNWFKVLDKFKDQITPQTILIGHSLGGAFILHVLERLDFPIKAAFLVAAPVGIMPIKNWETDKPFISKKFDWKKIKNNAEQFFVFHSDNDPYVGIENGREIAKNLGTELIFVPGAGHFNTAAGYTTFDLLLKRAKPLL